MHLPEFSKSRRISTGLAIAVGALGLAGCGNHNVSQGASKEGVYGKNFWVYPNPNSNNRLEARCIGTALYIKTIVSLDGSPLDELGSDDERTWLNDPACQDKVLTPSDNISGAIAEAATDSHGF